MTRNAIGPKKGNNLPNDTMSKQELEKYSTAIKDDFNHIDERFDAVDKRFDRLENRMEQGFNRLEKGFNRLESICFAILEIVRGHDVKFKNYENRLISLGKKSV